MNVAQKRFGYTFISEAIIEGLFAVGELLIDVLASVVESKEEKEENE